MDLRRLEVFCKVVELKSFTKAGEAVFLAQPSVSESIRGLEQIVGAKLIDRLGREAAPTEAGRILYGYARRISRLRQEAMQAIREHSGKIAGQLALGAGTIPGAYLLPEIIGIFRTRYPEVQFRLRIASSRYIADEVMKGDLELGVIGAKWQDTLLDWEEMFLDELVLTVFPEHPWSKRNSIALHELAETPFILREPQSGTRQVMTEILEREGLSISKLSVAAEMGGTEAVRLGIMSRIGVSILSRQAVAADIESGSLMEIPIDGVRFVRPFYLITRRNRELSPIGTIFLHRLRGAHHVLFNQLISLPNEAKRLSGNFQLQRLSEEGR